MDDLILEMMQLAAKGYVCSQIMMKMALELRDEENLPLVRAMAGPGYGCGEGSATCGTLMAGCCILALYTAKGSDDEIGSELLHSMQGELSEWFNQRIGERYGGISCDKIVGAAGPAASQQTCGALVADTYSKVMEIMTDHGIDPTAA